MRRYTKPRLSSAGTLRELTAFSSASAEAVINWSPLPTPTPTPYPKLPHTGGGYAG